MPCMYSSIQNYLKFKKRKKITHTKDIVSSSLEFFNTFDDSAEKDVKKESFNLSLFSSRLGDFVRNFIKGMVQNLARKPLSLAAIFHGHSVKGITNNSYTMLTISFMPKLMHLLKGLSFSHYLKIKSITFFY